MSSLVQFAVLLECVRKDRRIAALEELEEKLERTIKEHRAQNAQLQQERQEDKNARAQLEKEVEELRAVREVKWTSSKTIPRLWANLYSWLTCSACCRGQGQ